MSWKRSKDGGMDYNTSVETNYQKAKQKLFGDDRPKASWLIVSPEITKELEPYMKNQKMEQIRGRTLTSNDDIDVKLNLKKRLKQRIKKGNLR